MIEEKNLEAAIARELSLNSSQVGKAIALLDEGNTIPFLARYRKEATDGLDEVQLRALQESLEKRRKLSERKEVVLKSVEEQGKLTAEIAEKIKSADTMSVLEDLYLPFRPKRRTRAMIAREKGLTPLFEMLLEPSNLAPLVAAQGFIGEGVLTAEDALAGARDILAEVVAEDPEVRGFARRSALQDGSLVSAKVPKAEDPQEKYSLYYGFSEAVRLVQPHRVLAVDRGEEEGVLRVSAELPEQAILSFMAVRWKAKEPLWQEEIQKALADGLKRLLGPSIEREVRNSLTEKAQKHAISVFAANLKALLLQPPMRGQVVLAIDPGFRTGCKVVVVDATGKPLLDGFAIYPHEPQQRWGESVEKLRELISRYDVKVLAIGNGTASRESEKLVAEAIQGLNLHYVMVSEAGASVYSASEIAREEFPDLDATQRGTISIARRLQDPLAELVKIDPQAIGVGLYQHDLDQKALSTALDGVVEDAVNGVGVDLNTASAPLLAHVAGLNKKIAQAIVSARQAQGPFQKRKELLKVKGLGAKTFEQCAGFLRIPDGAEPLDNTGIHPESYQKTEELLSRLGLSARGIKLREEIKELKEKSSFDPKRLAFEVGIGIPTLSDILDNLEKPGRDPRDGMPLPHLRQDVLKMNDLKPGMRLTGTVRNVVDFGAFVDIGLKNAGLVHVSELADRFVRNPLEAVSVGEVIEVEVLTIDPERGRISLSRKRALRNK